MNILEVIKVKSGRPILFVEDDHVDAMAVERIFKEIGIPNKLYVANNGEEALILLKEEGREKPCFVLLDLNMPRMNGLEFLKIIKQDNDLKHIPVIILTSSNEEQDIIESFNLGVAGYMVKPLDYNEFVEIIRAVSNYWQLSELPPN